MKLLHTIAVLSYGITGALAGEKCGRAGCGYVQNGSPWNLRVTKAEKEISGNQVCKKDSPTPHYCRFDNWDAGFGIGGHDETVCCNQIEVVPMASQGGRNDRDDVDGLTYADRTWWYEGDKVAAGHWIKISDGTRVLCWNDNGKAKCKET